MPSLALEEVEPGYVREARARAADQQMIALTQEFIATQAAAAAAVGRDAVAILREEQARETPRVDQQEDYASWLAEQEALTLAMQSMYTNGDGSEADEDGSSERAALLTVADDAPTWSAAHSSIELREAMAVDADDEDGRLLQLERMEAAWREEQAALTARRQALQALYRPSGEEGSIMELQALQQQRHAARMQELQQQLTQAQIRQRAIDGPRPVSDAATEAERFEDDLRLAMRLSLATAAGVVATDRDGTTSTADDATSARGLACRFCFSSAEPSSLLYPCSCTAPVHRQCLQRWQRQQVGKSGNEGGSTCEVCRSSWTQQLRLTAGRATLEQWLENQSRHG